MKHQVSIIDYAERGKSLYIQVEVYDAILERRFNNEEVRFLDDLLYGGLVHPNSSPLSENCRLKLIEYLKKYFDR